MTKTEKKVAAKSAKTPAKKTPAKNAAPTSTPAAAPVALKRERREIRLADLAAAPWNPRSGITDDSVADLAASIRTLGLIQPIVVMAAAKGSKAPYLIVAGHRRAVACRLAGLESAPCDVLVDVDERDARRMTFIENLQRQDANPVLESELVGRLLADGMTPAEIAAETGRAEKWVTRRANLVKLSPSWRKRAMAGKISTDCLEHVAAFPVEIQERLKKVDEWRDTNEAGLRWHDIDHEFNNETRELKDATFDTTPCRTCTSNSGVTPDLFDWGGDKPATLGRCLCPKCYAKKRTAAREAVISKARADGVTIVKSRPDFSVKASPTQTKKCTVLHVFENYNGETVLEWAEPGMKSSSSKSAALSAKEARERQKKRDRNKAIRKLIVICQRDGNLAKWLAEFFRDPSSGEIVPHSPFVVSHLFSGIDSWKLPGSNTNEHDAAVSFVLSPAKFHVPDDFASVVAGLMVDNMDPSRRGGYRAETNAPIVCHMFEKEILAAGLTADEFARICDDKARAELTSVAVEWRRASAPEVE